LSNERWHVSSAEFQGYVKARLEDIRDDMKEMKGCLSNVKKTAQSNKEEIGKIKAFSSFLGMVGGVIITLITRIFWR